MTTRGNGLVPALLLLAALLVVMAMPDAPEQASDKNTTNDLHLAGR